MPSKTEEKNQTEDAQAQSKLPVAGDRAPDELARLRAENAALLEEKSKLLEVNEELYGRVDELDSLKERVARMEGFAAGVAQGGSAAPGLTTEQVQSVEQSIEDTRDLLKKQKHYLIKIPSTETQKEAVQVSINGYAFNLPRDKEVEVPQAVLNVLNDAVVTYYELLNREQGEGMEMVEHQTQRFPYQTSVS